VTASSSLQRRIADYYQGARMHRAPDRVLTDTLYQIESTKQRRVPWALPRRFQKMNSKVRLAATAAAIVAFVAVGLALLSGNPPGVGTRPTASPTPTPSPSPTLMSSPSPSPSVPLVPTETFTSGIYGISLSYPDGWTTRRATEWWTRGVPLVVHDYSDLMLDDTTQDLKFISVASQPLGASSGDEWVDILAHNRDWENRCAPRTEPTNVDGASGLLVEWCGDLFAAIVATPERGYAIALFGTRPALPDKAFFQAILDSVALDPLAAVDPSPPASPSTSP